MSTAPVVRHPAKTVAAWLSMPAHVGGACFCGARCALLPPEEKTEMQPTLFDIGPSFPCLVMDPPWAERGGGKIKRGADRHYALATQEEIVRAVTKSPLFAPAENAHAWVWVTDNFLEDGLGLLDAMGFRYVRTFVWVKAAEADPEGTLRFGIGQYARGAHELLLFGVRGKGQDGSVWQGHRDVPSVFFAPVPVGEDGKRIHSRKPDASYQLIERVSRGPYVEFFARRKWGPDWSVWGNEAPGEGEDTSCPTP